MASSLFPSKIHVSFLKQNHKLSFLLLNHELQRFEKAYSCVSSILVLLYIVSSSEQNLFPELFYETTNRLQWSINGRRSRWKTSLDVLVRYPIPVITCLKIYTHFSLAGDSYWFRNQMFLGWVWIGKNFNLLFSQPAVAMNKHHSFLAIFIWNIFVLGICLPLVAH